MRPCTLRPRYCTVDVALFPLTYIIAFHGFFIYEHAMDPCRTSRVNSFLRALGRRSGSRVNSDTREDIVRHHVYVETDVGSKNPMLSEALMTPDESLDGDTDTEDELVKHASILHENAEALYDYPYRRDPQAGGTGSSFRSWKSGTSATDYKQQRQAMDASPAQGTTATATWSAPGGGTGSGPDTDYVRLRDDDNRDDNDDDDDAAGQDSRGRGAATGGAGTTTTMC